MLNVAESFVRRTKRNNQCRNILLFLMGLSLERLEAVLKEERPSLVKTGDVFHYDN